MGQRVCSIQVSSTAKGKGWVLYNGSCSESAVLVTVSWLRAVKENNKVGLKVKVLLWLWVVTVVSYVNVNVGKSS